MSVQALTRGQPRTVAGQTLVGVGLASLLVGAWLALHIHDVFFLPLRGAALAAAPILILLQTWLNVGLFIVAHDAMHGSLAPGRPGVNLWMGRLCLGLYAGFWYDRLISKHFDHHRASGTADDPDFHAPGPRRFWPWYLAFFRRYFGIGEFMIVSGLLLVYALVLGASPLNMALFWGVPALLSSAQLFYFGTYLPHRHEDEPFGDEHRARSNDFGWLASLVTCFHFGYHHEHHREPHLPWWRLPSAVQRGRA